MLPFTLDLSQKPFLAGPIEEKFLNQFSLEELSIYRENRYNGEHVIIERDRIKKTGKKDR